MDSPRIHAFSFPVRGQCGSSEYIGPESAEPFDGIQGAVQVYSIQTAEPFDSIETTVTFRIETFAFRFEAFEARGGPRGG